MGGYNSGRTASNKKSIDQFLMLDICHLYREGVLTSDKRIVVRYSCRYVLTVQRMCDHWGWKQCLRVRYPIRVSGVFETREQVIGFEMVDVLSGKTQRPYFFCPRLEDHASKLFLGAEGFAHRTYYGNLYHSQRMGHFDRAVASSRRLKKKLSCSDNDAATDPPRRPKGMHKKTYEKHLAKHSKAIVPS